MSVVAFVGLGIMGRPMAANLVAAGHDLRGVARSKETRQRAVQSSIPVGDDLADAVHDADIVITMLPDTPDVQSVVDRVLPVLPAGALLIDMSTIDPVATRSMHEAVAAAGGAMLDAPVSGGEAGAIEGSLSIMAGGTAAAFERALPVLQAMGTTIVHVGAAGAGQAVKAANQLIVAGNIQLVAEALVLLQAQGVDEGPALDVIGGGLAGSAVLTRKRSAFLTSDFRPGFRLALHAKDLGIVESAARSSGLALPLTAAVTQFVRALVARGDGGLDHSALYKLAGELNGYVTPRQQATHDEETSR